MWVVWSKILLPLLLCSDGMVLPQLEVEVESTQTQHSDGELIFAHVVCTIFIIFGFLVMISIVN